MHRDFTTIKTLLQRAKNSEDHKAWEEFQEFYSSYIYMVLYKLLPDKEDLEDLKQEILIKLWKNLKNYRVEKSKFRTWLYTVIRFTVLSHFRKKSNDSKKLLSFVEESSANSHENYINEIIFSEWKTYITNLALDRIKPKFTATAVKIFYMTMDELSVKEIAAKLSLNSDSVYKMRSRFLDRLAKEISMLRTQNEF